MYLYKALQNSSHCVERGCLGNQNIDFLIKYRDRDVYIEATAPTRGEEGNEILFPISRQMVRHTKLRKII